MAKVHNLAYDYEAFEENAVDADRGIEHKKNTAEKGFFSIKFMIPCRLHIYLMARIWMSQVSAFHHR